MNRSQISKIIFVLAAMALLANATALFRDYQDSWILEGLIPTFAVFMGSYALALFLEQNNKWMVVLAVAGQTVFLLVPNLKYAWFQGIWIDQSIQYNLASHVHDAGHISAPGPFTASIYVTTPLIHLSFAIFSLVLGTSVMLAVKYVPVLLGAIYPLSIYTIMRRLNLSQERTALKYALFLSSLPIFIEYVVGGTPFGAIIVSIVLSTLVSLLSSNDRRYLFIFVFLVFALAAFHSSSSVLLTLFLLMIFLLQRFHHFRLNSYLKSSAVFATVTISLVWLVFSAGATFDNILSVFVSGASGGPTPGAEQIPSRFFELIHTNFLGALNTALVFYGGEICLLLTALVGLVVLLKVRSKLNAAWRFLIVFVELVFLAAPVGLLLRVGLFRVLYFAGLLSPIFCAVAILSVSKKRAWLGAIVLLPIMILAPVEFYACQPLIPSSHSVSPNLPTNEPIVYVDVANSVYQRQLVFFARDYATGTIASDDMTTNQIVGLTDLAFVLKHVGWVTYYPIGKNQSQKYDYFLIHVPGISGGFAEPAELRTSQRILDAIYNSSVAYSNGESYFLIHIPTGP
jgi:hypothetical protein